MRNDDLTVIIPAYNDAAGLALFLPELIEAADRHGWEILIVDDGSADETQAALEKFKPRVRVLRNRANRGYGFALKRGIMAATTEWVATMDADGQHRVEDLEKMRAERAGDVDAIIGARGKDSHQPLARRPGKWLLARAANLLAGSRIPDINCGLRILRRSVMLCILPVASDRFSFSTSSLIALIQLGCEVVYFPVIIKKRVGKSTVRQFRDGLYTLMLLARLAFLFQPARVLLPLSLLLLLTALALLGAHIFVEKMTYSIIMVWLTGLLIFLFSLLADQVSGVRRDALLRAIARAKGHMKN